MCGLDQVPSFSGMKYLLLSGFLVLPSQELLAALNVISLTNMLMGYELYIAKYSAEKPLNVFNPFFYNSIRPYGLPHISISDLYL